MVYRVTHSIISIGGRTAHRGEELTEHDFAGIDVHRLIGLGAVVLVDDDTKSEETGEVIALDLSIMKKAQLSEVAAAAGLDLGAGMTKAQMIDAIEARHTELIEQAESGDEESENGDADDSDIQSGADEPEGSY